MRTILIAGLGSAGQRHARNLRRLLGGDVRLLAYRTTRHAPLLDDAGGAETGASVEQALGIESFDDLGAALAQAPDAVFVCNPTRLHVPVALAAARAGCHLFIEKPVSADLADTDALLSEVRARGLVTLVGYQLRFHPCLQHAKRQLEAGVIGRLLAVEATFAEALPRWHPWEDYRQSYAARRELGGGVVLTQIHDLDSLTWLVGPARRVFAVGGHLSALEVDVEDTASLLMACTVDDREVPVSLHQNVVEHAPVRRYVFRGDAGTIDLDVAGNVVSTRDASGRDVDRFAPVDFDRNQLFVDELRHFLDCLDGTAAPCVPLADGLVSLRLACAALDSMTRGRAVVLD